MNRLIYINSTIKYSQAHIRCKESSKLKSLEQISKGELFYKNQILD